MTPGVPRFGEWLKLARRAVVALERVADALDDHRPTVNRNADGGP